MKVCMYEISDSEPEAYSYLQNTNEYILNSRFVYKSIVYHCIHYGKARMRGFPFNHDN